MVLKTCFLFDLLWAGMWFLLILSSSMIMLPETNIQSGVIALFIAGILLRRILAKKQLQKRWILYSQMGILVMYLILVKTLEFNKPFSMVIAIVFTALASLSAGMLVGSNQLIE